MRSKVDQNRVEFVRHHGFIPRFDSLYDQWFLVINPTYHFTTNGFLPHSYHQALLAGKKRLDKSASLRGQLIMWHRLLTQDDPKDGDMFAETLEPRIAFGEPPVVALPTQVPEDAWGSPRKTDEKGDDEFDLLRFA